MFSLIYHFIIYSRNNADAANFLDVLRQAVAAAPQAPQAAVLNATRETMPFLVYPSNFFNEDQTAEDNLSFSSDYYKLPFDPDMGNAVGSLTTALNELDTNLTNPNLPKKSTKANSIDCLRVISEGLPNLRHRNPESSLRQSKQLPPGEDGHPSSDE